jgi:hypothetical protein
MAFTGAEESVDKQKRSALDALAQFGRRGLEAAVLSQQESNRVADDATAANSGFATERGVDARGQAELAALQAPAKFAYGTERDAARVSLRDEMGALGSVNENYYNQVREAVPLERTAAEAIRDQYRAAWEQRQLAAQAEQRRHQEMLQQIALQQQLERERMAREAELHRLTLLGIDPLTGQPVDPTPTPTPSPGFIPWAGTSPRTAPTSGRMGMG